ncbi:hypothetical protein [Candidatus Nitrososphaera sp. FF02]|uniref:hypothetical protein n=1 Tax=Candidatus Nitrososphaera sp. FF02 TaxID=3398226 RepID=UPI0039EB2DE5
MATLLPEKTKNELWKKAVKQGIITIPQEKVWITKRINFPTMAKQVGFTAKAPEIISLDYFDKLPEFLRNEIDCGILHLGRNGEGALAGTDFVLCKPTGGANSLYLHDEDIFRNAQELSPRAGSKDVIQQILRLRLEEKSGLNAFQYIFPFESITRVSDYVPFFFPYKSNITFSFKPDTSLEPLTHGNGQVDCDCNTVILSHGKPVSVFSIEAKFGNVSRSISKQKMLNSFMLSRKLFPDLPVRLAYLRIEDRESLVRFLFCLLTTDFEGEVPVLTSITAEKSYSLTLPRSGTLGSFA